MSVFLVTATLCLLPISELRGGLPFALSHGWHPAVALAVCTVLNALAVPLTYGFLATAHRLLLRWDPYRRFAERVLERARRRVAPQVERYGWCGLLVFVGVPLPFTGAYTGALGAWVLGLPFRRAFPPAAAGIVVAALIVTAAYYLVTAAGVEALRFLLKE